MPFDPFDPATPPTVRGIVLYDPLRPEQRELVDLEWSQEKTLDGYLDGLPEANWVVAVSGRVVERDEWPSVTLLQDDTLVLALLPEKGASQILSIVAIVAIAIAAPYIAGPSVLALEGFVYTAFVTAVTVGGAMLVNTLLPPPKPKLANPDASTSENDASPSYGLDGPKPTAREDAPLGVVYGEHRVGGNRINYYSQTTADGLSQDLYMQYAVCDGEVESISDILINDQPVANFQAVEVQTGLGDPGQGPSPWFTSTITPYSNGATLTQTPTLYNTIDEVDRVRLDITFPNGLYSIDRNTGNRTSRRVDLYARLTRLDSQGNLAGPLIPFDAMAWQSIGLDGNSRVAAGPSRMRLTVRVDGQTGFNESTPFTCQVTVNAVGGVNLLSRTETGVVANVYAADGSWVGGEKLFSYEINLDAARETEVLVSGGTVILVEIYQPFATIERNERSPLRITLDSGALARGRYQVTIARGNPETASDYEQDRCLLAAVNEIQADPVALRRTAWYGIKIRLTDQLSSEPTPTALVRGRKVWIYDVNGTKIEYRWSNNPADVSLDILLSEDWQRPLDPSRIDFSFFARWRNFCSLNNLTFNGVFDYRTTVWDALKDVMRAGRASPLVSGIRWSGVIEGPDEPTMMFGSQNIITETFENFWLGRESRANQIEVQYYDKDDNYRRNSVFAIDEAAMLRGEPIRPATINLIGVTSREQAQAEADMQLRMNTLLAQGCRFSSTVEAIGCIVGDVILVQHDLPKWGWGDRIKSVARWPIVDLHRQLDPAGNQNPNLPSLTALGTDDGQTIVAEEGLSPADGDPDFAVMLDRPTTSVQEPMPDGDWRILVLKPALRETVAEILTVSGSQISVQGQHNLAISRIIIAGQDYEVLDQVVIGSTTSFKLDRGPGAVAAKSAELWRTAVMLEGSIARPNQFDRFVTVTSWTHSVGIAAEDQVLIGRVGKFKKPFRVTQIKAGTEGERTLECIEYNEAIYAGAGGSVPPNYSEIPATPLQVINLTARQENLDVQGGGVRYFAVANWERPLNDLRGHAGSKVWVSVNGGAFLYHETVTDGRQESRIEAQVGDTIRFRVVAMDRAGFLAPFAFAPTATVTIGNKARVPEKPTGLTATGGTRLISVTWNLPNDPDIREIEVWENVTDSLFGAYVVEVGYRRFFARSGLDPLETRYFWVRSVSYAGVPSDFVGPVSATTTRLIADDIEQGILDVSKFAQSIAPVGLVDGVPELRGENPLIIFDTQTELLYRWNGVAYVPRVSKVLAGDVEGTLTGEQIADLAVGPEKLAAGAVTTNKLAVGSANIIFNSTLTYDTGGWVAYADMPPGAPWAFGSALADGYEAHVPPDVGGGYVHISALAATILTNANFVAVSWKPRDMWGIPVTPGKRYHFSAMVAALRIRARIDIVWLDEAGQLISGQSSRNVDPSFQGGIWDDKFDQLGVVLTAPTNARYAIAQIVAYGTNAPLGVKDAFLFFTKTMFGEAPANAIEAPTWTPGGLTEVSGGQIRTRTLAADRLVAGSVTADELAANSVVAGKIAAGAIKADQIAAKEIQGYHLAATNIITRNSQIANAVIKEANIEDAAIKRAKIGDLEVDTIKIANNAVTDYAISSWSGVYSGPHVVVASAAIGDTYGGKFMVNASAFGANGSYSFYDGGGSSNLITVGLLAFYTLWIDGQLQFTSQVGLSNFNVYNLGPGVHLFKVAIQTEDPPGSGILSSVLPYFNKVNLAVMHFKR